MGAQKRKRKRMLVPLPTGRAPAAPGSPTPGIVEPTAAASVIELQRSMGNAAVAELMRKTAVAEAAPKQQGAGTRRAAFEQAMADRFGVKRVRAGTEADQVAEMRSGTPSSEASPATIEGWQGWEPASGSALFDDIEAAFEKMTKVLGGIPDVDEIRFLESAYENVGGIAQKRPRHGANFGARILSIFRRTETLTWALADARSTDAAPGSVTPASVATSRRWVIVHELAHGVAERFGTPGAPGGEAGFFAAFNRAAGWSGGVIVQNGVTLTDANWNQPWPEQPMSRYSLANPGEDFAESLLAYIEKPDVLKARSPARFEFFDSRKARWAGHLRKPGPTP